MRLRLLLPLATAACLPVDDPTSQDASNTGSAYLQIAKRAPHDKVFIGDAELPANVTETIFSGRTDKFGNPVQLQANTPLKDKDSLKFSRVKFDFEYEQQKYLCTLSPYKKDPPVPLLQKMPFSLDDCVETAHQYGQYLLTGKNDARMSVAIKIEMGQDGTPSKLHVRDLAFEQQSAGVEIVELSWKGKALGVFGKNGYEGSVGDNKYLVKYPKEAKKIADKIKKGEMPALEFHLGGDTYKSKEDSIHSLTAAYYELLTLTKLSDELKTYFKEKCKDNAGLGETTPSDASPGTEINGRTYSGHHYTFGQDDGCQHTLYGLTNPSVIAYLQQCQASCSSDAEKGDESPLLIDIPGDKDITLACDSESKQVAFYLDKDKLHVDSEGDGEKWSTQSYSCAQQEEAQPEDSPSQSQQ